MLTVWLPGMCSCGSTPIPERETELSDVREREFRRPERETEVSDVRERESSGVHKPEVCGVWQATGGMPSLFSREHIFTTPLANSTPLVSACETSEERMSLFTRSRGRYSKNTVRFSSLSNRDFAEQRKADFMPDLRQITRRRTFYWT